MKFIILFLNIIVLFLSSNSFAGTIQCVASERLGVANTIKTNFNASSEQSNSKVILPKSGLVLTTGISPTKYWIVINIVNGGNSVIFAGTDMGSPVSIVKQSSTLGEPTIQVDCKSSN